MLQKTIITESAPAPGNYSQGRVIDFGNYSVLYTAGQTGNYPDSGEVVEGGCGLQTRQALENILAIIKEAGGEKKDIVKITVFLTDMKNDKAEFEKEYVKFFSENLPARSLVEVSQIPLYSEDTIVEIEAIAYIKK